MTHSLLKLTTRRPKRLVRSLLLSATVISLAALATTSFAPRAYAQICGSIGFYSPVNFPVGGRLQSVDVGDFNLDGKHDLVTANAVTTVVSVLLGKGDGNFETSVDVDAGNNPGDAAVGDFNGDSKPDIAVANAGGNNISVLINTCAAAPCGSPSFAAPVNYASGNRPRRIATGDVNRDNVLDLMTANENSNSVSVLLGNGNGTFQAKVDYNPIGTQPYDVQVGDFNGDNKLDMVAVNFGMGDTAAVFINTCNATPCAAPSFAAAVTYAVGESPMGVTTADFNGDNRLDLATANYFSSDVSILLGNGNGTFQNAVNYPSASLPNNITATDLDGDSYLDLVTAVDIGSLISVFRGRGDGTFEAKADFNVGQSGASDVSKAVAAEDFNGDTLIDLAVAVDMFNNVSMMMNGCGDPPVSNTAPSITAGSALSRTQAAGAANATVATVSDAETAAGSLSVTATTVPTGITVNNITNTGGTITADVAAACSASAGANTVVLTVTDEGSMTNTANLTVNVTANTTGISSHPGDQTVVVGQSATFSVTGSGTGLSYQWRKGGSPIGGANASSYTIDAATLGDAGSYDVVVTGACGSVPSNAATLTVNKADTTLALASSQNPADVGQSVTFTATVSVTAPGAGTPTGTVQFLDGGSSVTGCASVALSGGQAQCVTSSLGAGNHTITAQYGGDASFNTSNGNLAGNPQVVNKITPTVTWNNPADIQYGTALSATQLNATASAPGTFSYTPASGTVLNAGAAQTLTVNFTPTDAATYTDASETVQINVSKADQTITFGALSNRTYGDAPFNVSATATSTLPVSFQILSGPATISGSAVTVTGTGTVIVRASQAGDANHNAAVDVDQSFTVNKADQTITFGVLPDKTYGDAPFSLSASSSSALPVSFSVVSGPASISGNTLTINGAGTVVVRAAQGGDANYNAAPGVDRTFTVAKAQASITLSSLSHTYDGSVKGATATTDPAHLTGVSLSYSRNGVAVAAPTGAGSYSVVASLTNDNYQATNATGTLVINKAEQTITFGALPARTFGDAPFTLSATASTGLPVSFQVVSGPATVSGSTLTVNGAGTVVVRATQAGDGNYNAAANVERSFDVARAATATAVNSSANPSDFGQEVTFTATVTSAAGVPAGAVTFTAGTQALGAVTLNASGVATVKTAALAPGWYVVTATYDGDANFLAGSGSLANGQAVNGPPAISTTVQFTSADYSVAENGRSVEVTVERTGDTSAAATVNYSDADGSIPSVYVPCSTATGAASERCDYTAARGTLRFAPGEEVKTFTVLVTDDTYAEGPEILQLVLSDPTGGAEIGVQGSTTLTIEDDDEVSAGNSMDETEAFVRQLYHDFFNREPDADGLQFWMNKIDQCGTDLQCREVERINTSAAFFLSIEFQRTGFLVYRTYAAAHGLTRVGDTVPLTFGEFLPDVQQIGRGVAVGAPGWEATLEANQQAYFEEFVTRPAFASAYPSTLSPAEFVGRLNANAGSALSPAEVEVLAAQLAANDTDAGRVSALRAVAESAALKGAEMNRAFVLMQYFGYLRRDPNVAPDAGFEGFNFWLGKLDEFGGDFQQAEMVKAFINSVEHRGRFGNDQQVSRPGRGR